MERLIQFGLLYFLASQFLTAQTPMQLSKIEAQEDINALRTALEYVHPRLYQYNNKENFDDRFDSIHKSLNGEISGLDFLSIVSKLNASVNCGHLYTIPQGNLENEVLNKKVLPFYFKVIGNELFVLKNCSAKERIPDGSKIISINNVPTSEILKDMMEGIATDGYIETRKRRLAERYFFYEFHGFDLYYHLHVDRSTSFKLDYLPIGSDTKKSTEVDGISIENRKKILKARYGLEEGSWFKEPSPKFELFEDENYGVLTISRSFYDKSIDPDYDSLLAKSFRTLKQKKIPNLIIDLRDNEGGSEHQEMELISYLSDKPYKLYQNIYLSNLDFRPLKSVILERDSTDLLFNNDDRYMRKFGNELYINNYEYSDNLQLQPPKENVFEGQLYVLMNGISFSSTAAIIADIKKTTNAIFVGEECGGTFEGPTGGDSIVIALPNSKIMVRISPNIQVGYMYQKHPIGRGVLPDHHIEYSIEDVLSEKDLEMEMVVKLIIGNSP
ncbi:S41 family peptidase [Ulvibacterium sp.]|uniref:S41 family peptidase n=1 Tax=Ulvibacterium sp. TaxID=2665914 RepID=UPI003BAACFFB